MTSHKPTVLITGATGQIGGDTLRNLLADKTITLVAAVRSHAKAQSFTAQGIRTVIMDFDQEHTLAPALEGIDRALLVTGYTVDMLRQSKAFIDQAKKSGVQHLVHLGACGRDDTTIGHWAWHQFVERYIEWSGFSFTHLRPECFMQNLLSYDGTRAVINGGPGGRTSFVAPAKACRSDLSTGLRRTVLWRYRRDHDPPAGPAISL